MTFKGNDAGGGTQGTTVTTGNSGGFSGTAWDSPVTIGTGAAITFDNTHIIDSPFAYKMSTGATAAQAILTWNTTFSDDEVWGTVYCYITSYATMSTSTVAIRLRGAGTQTARLSFLTSGKMRISDTATANSVNTNIACPVNAFFRVDYHVKVTGGLGDIWLYTTDPRAPVGNFDDHISTSGANYGANPVDEFGFGTVANNSNVGPYWFGYMAASNISTPGPQQLWLPSSAQRRIYVPAYPRRLQMRTTVPVQDDILLPAQPRTRVRINRPARTRSAAPVAAPAVVTPPPYPPQPSHRLRQALGRFRGRMGMPVPTTTPVVAPPYPPQPLRHIRQVIARTRAKSLNPPRDQEMLLRTPTSRRFRHVLAKVRGRIGMPIPPQIIVAPTKTPQPLRRLVRIVGRGRSKASRPVVTQDLVLPRQRKVRLPWPLRRGKAPTSSQAIPDIPKSARKPSKIIALLSRRRTSRAQQPVVPIFPPKSVHHVTQAIARQRGRSFTPVPPQVSPLAPAYVPRPTRIIRQFLTTFRRHWKDAVFPARVIRPDIRVKLGLLETKWVIADLPNSLGAAYRAPVNVGDVELKWELGRAFGSPFTIGLMETKWVIGGGDSLLALSVATREYVRVPASAIVDGQPVNPVAFTVQMAFLTSNSVSPSSGDWVSASWDTISPSIPKYVAQCLVGTGGDIALAIGTYYVWVRILATPEAIVRQIDDVLQITV